MNHVYKRLVYSLMLVCFFVVATAWSQPYLIASGGEFVVDLKLDSRIDSAVQDDIIPVKLPKGRSRIMLKISNLGINWGFCFRITDTQGAVAHDLTFDLIAPSLK